MNNKLLYIQNLHVTYHTKGQKIEAVRGVDLDVNENEIVALIGESGSGKTALAKSILQLQTGPYCTIDQGQILFEGNNLLASDLRSVRGLSISMILQDPMTALNPMLKISTQMIEAILTHRNISRAEAKKECIKALELVDINEPEQRMKQYPHQLSGGICQRVLIAMSVLNCPKLIIADELTTALDATTKTKLMLMLKKLQTHFALSLLIISHDLGFVSGIADRIYVMYGGKICETGQTDSIFYDPKHPYTKALLDSLPKDLIGANLRPIKGHSNVKNTSGCVFCQRCDYAMNICRDTPPPKYENRVFCHLYNEHAKGQYNKFKPVKADEKDPVTSTKT
jgi:oligopeptide/dipeptide ABC transporter ATP-binding protein